MLLDERLGQSPHRILRQQLHIISTEFKEYGALTESMKCHVAESSPYSSAGRCAIFASSKMSCQGSSRILSHNLAYGMPM